VQKWVQLSTPERAAKVSEKPVLFALFVLLALEVFSEELRSQLFSPLLDALPTAG